MSSSLSKINLIQSGGIWSFCNESELEKFIWENIHSLNLTPLKKQYFINGQYCDILAVDSQDRLTIIELKNTEDRYVIQQLTRYYDALVNSKPFSDIIDYSKEPRLIAICPHFHRDNLIDIRYHKLDVELIEFRILQENLNFFCILKALSGNISCNLEIAYRTSNSERHLPPPPRKLTNHLLNLDEGKRQTILNIREQIIGFDPRINEIVSGSHVFYGKTEKTPCAELFFSPTFKSIKLFLWLPHPRRKKICRMAIGTKDFVSVDSFDYSSKGTKHNESVDIPGYSGIYNCWQDPALMIKWIETDKDNYWAYAANEYAKLMACPERANSLDLLVEIALDKWLEKVSPKPAKLLEEVPVLR